MRTFIENFPLPPMVWDVENLGLGGVGTIILEFDSARPSIVKSIKQRDLLNTSPRLYARAQELPSLGLDTLPEPRPCCVIDRDLFHRAPGRIEAGDVIEFI